VIWYTVLLKYTTQFPDQWCDFVGRWRFVLIKYTSSAFTFLNTIPYSVCVLIVNDAWKNRNENKQSMSRSHFPSLETLGKYMRARERQDGRKTTRRTTRMQQANQQTKKKRAEKGRGE